MKPAGRLLLAHSFAVLLAAGRLPAQQPELRFLHCVLVADTNAADIGPSCKEDLARMKKLLEAIPKDRREITCFEGKEVNKNGILEFVGNLNIDENQGFLFYYAGHGGLVGKEHFFTFSGNKKENSDGTRDLSGDLSRDRLRSAIQASSPGLVIILTDCCSSFIKQKKLPAPVFFPPPNRLPPGYSQLFFKSRGLVDITGADDGRPSWCTPNGGIFTKAFCDTLIGVSEDRDVNWSGLYGQLKKKTEETALRIQEKQTSRAFQLPGVTWGFGILESDDQRLIVIEVSGLAERAGLKKNEVILKVNGKDVKNTMECVTAVREAKLELRLTVRSADNRVVERVLKRD